MVFRALSGESASVEVSAGLDVSVSASDDVSVSAGDSV
eukprot:COSAG04_NODE_31614_length_256_cov_0.286624_1_plen_37_part_01